MIHPPPAARCSAARPTACSEAGPCLPRGAQEGFDDAHARLAEARRVLAEQCAKVPAPEAFDEARKLLAVGAPPAPSPCASLGRTDAHAAAVGSLISLVFLIVVTKRVFLSFLSFSDRHHWVHVSLLQAAGARVEEAARQLQLAEEQHRAVVAHEIRQVPACPAAGPCRQPRGGPVSSSGGLRRARGGRGVGVPGAGAAGAAAERGRRLESVPHGWGPLSSPLPSIHSMK